MRVLQIHDKEQPSVLGGNRAAAGWRWSERAGGGLALYLSHLVGGLRDRGWHVGVIALTSRPERRDGGTDGSYELRSFRYRLRTSVLSDLDRIVRAEAPDVIHLHSIPTLHPAIVRRLTRACPVVWMFHDVTPLCFRGTKLLPDGEPCSRPLGYRCVSRGCFRIGRHEGRVADAMRVLSFPVYLRAYRRASLMAVPSTYLKDVFVTNGFAEERVQVVPLFSRFDGKTEVGPTGESSRGILFVGRLIQEKGIVEFVRALADLADEDWSARVVGDGPMQARARELVERLGLGARVEFTGAGGGEGLARHYAWSDLVVVPSLVAESFNLVGVEAFSFGKPVVGFASGGITEWLEDGATGFLVPHEDGRALAARMADLIRDPDLRRRMGKVGRRRHRDRYTPSHHLDRIESIYRHDTASAGGGEAPQW